MIFENEKSRISFVYLSSLLSSVAIGVTICDNSYLLAALNASVLLVLALSMGEHIWSSK